MRCSALFWLTLLGMALGRMAGTTIADDAVPDQVDTAEAAMTDRIDELLEASWRAASIRPAPLADDAEFLRRVSLDLTGVIPRVAEARRFLDDPSPNRRARLIDELLASPAHATHLANTWRNLMLPGGLDAEQVQNVAGVQNWLRSQFMNRLRYDRLVADLLVATGGGESGPALYYTSLELKPEKLAASTARIFLGLQIECAECHDHPYDHWKQKDFWGYAAFFARLRQSETRSPRMNVSLLDTETGDVRLPGGEDIIPPQFPGGTAAADPEENRRVQLAIWMASRDNPYLAKSAVNRVWAQMFGRGLVEPVDDLADRNPPSHPELFQELTTYFARSGFDLQSLYRVLANTRAYQLSSMVSDSAPPVRTFAVMPLKTLSAEQIYECLQRLGGAAVARGGANSSIAAALDPQRRAFLAQLAATGRSVTEYNLGVPQALTLLNGNQIGDLSAPDKSSLLQALEAPWFNDVDRVETLFLACLTRRPTQDEQQWLLEQLPEETSQRTQAWGDILWSLLNSAEFAFNH